eukprot:tig00020610_g12082.t1
MESPEPAPGDLRRAKSVQELAQDFLNEQKRRTRKHRHKHHKSRGPGLKGLVSPTPDYKRDVAYQISRYRSDGGVPYQSAAARGFGELERSLSRTLPEVEVRYRREEMQNVIMSKVGSGHWNKDADVVAAIQGKSPTREDILASVATMRAERLSRATKSLPKLPYVHIGDGGGMTMDSFRGYMPKVPKVYKDTIRELSKEVEIPHANQSLVGEGFARTAYGGVYVR